MLFATIVLTVAFFYFLLRWATSATPNAGTGTFSPFSATSLTQRRYLRDLLQKSRVILQKSTLEERAAPNRRLVQVFGIDNAFTTTDEDYYNTFIVNVRAKLSTTSDEWRVLAEAVRTDVSRYLERNEDSAGSVNLINLVQTIVFRAVMVKFFPQHQMASDNNIRSITTQINTLWMSSKDDAYLTSGSLIEDRLDLDANLHEIFDSQQNVRFSGKENPLNVILPAYETLWRIVLRLFLELRFRSSGDFQYHQYLPLLDSFSRQPESAFNVQTLARSTHDPEKIVEGILTMKNIVNEGLRLYPPTRRIYRQISGEKIAVDVEALHRDRDLWGDDAFKFRPTRFQAMRVRTSHFLPFGSGVFECPAKASFGPIMIGIIVASLAVEIDWDYRLSGCGAEDVMANKEPLGNGRNALEGLCIEKLQKF